MTALEADASEIAGGHVQVWQADKCLHDKG